MYWNEKLNFQANNQKERKKLYKAQVPFAFFGLHLAIGTFSGNPGANLDV